MGRTIHGRSLTGSGSALAGLIVREGITYLSRIEGAQDPLVCPRLRVRFEAGQRTSRRRRWPLRDRGGREVIFHLSPGSLTLGRGPTTTISHRAVARLHR